LSGPTARYAHAEARIKLLKDGGKYKAKVKLIGEVALRDGAVAIGGKSPYSTAAYQSALGYPEELILAPHSRLRMLDVVIIFDSVSGCCAKEVAAPQQVPSLRK